MSKEEFLQITDLQQNPLVQRVIELFDTDGNGEVDFKGTFHIHPITSCWSILIYSPHTPEFIEGISQFGVKGDKEAKLKCKR